MRIDIKLYGNCRHDGSHTKHCKWYKESHRVSELGSSHDKNTAAAQ